MNNRGMYLLLAAVLAVSASNLVATLYFQMGKPSASGESRTAVKPPGNISDQQAIAFARAIVDLYNAGKDHDLYLRFADAARAEYSEQRFTDGMRKLRDLFGRVEDYEYSDSELIRDDGETTYVALEYRARTSRTTFNSNTLKIVAASRNGRMDLFNFTISGSVD